MVLKGNGPKDTGALLVDGKILVLWEGKFVNGFSRFGNVLSGEAQIAHEIAHASTKLDPKIKVGQKFASTDPMNWAKEAAVSLEATEILNLSEIAIRELIEDARRSLIYAEHLKAFQSALSNRHPSAVKEILDGMRAVEEAK